MKPFVLEMVRGDTPKWRFTFLRAGSPVHLLGSTIAFTAKRELTDPDASAIFKKTYPGTIILVGGSGALGQIEVSLASADTASLLDRDYLLPVDVQLNELVGGIQSFRGTLHVTCDVTDINT